MSKMFLFHKDHPQGKMFDIETVRAKQDEMKESGWVDSPSLLDLPKPKPKLITDDAAKEATPQALIAMVKALGYMVLTEVEFTAEVSKAAHQLHIDAKAAEENLAAEIKAESEKPAASISEEDEKLISQFYEDAFSLTKPELIGIGKLYDVRLTMNHNEATMVEKLKEAIEA